MALNKLTYVDNVTVIPASNLNAIQDEIIANGTNVASVKSEVENIRVGVDGTTYATAGDAVRGQVGDLNDNVDNIDAKISTYLLAYKGPVNLLHGTWTNGYLINSSGVPTENSGYCYSDYFEVEAGKKIAATSVQATATTRRIENQSTAFYDKNKTFISRSTDAIKTVPSGAAFARQNCLIAYNNDNYKPMVEYTDDNGTIAQTYSEWFEPYNILKADYGANFQQKKLCVFGDSLAANGNSGDNAWINVVGDMLNFKEVYNRGIGSTRVSATETRYAYVDSDGYAYMRASYTTHQSLAGYTEIDACLSSVDRANTIPTDTDVVIILAGANDPGNVSADNFETAYKAMLDNIYARVPNAKILLGTLLYNHNWDANSSIVGVLNNFRTKIKNVGAEYGYPVIDFKSLMGVNNLNYATYMDNDNVHYNTKDEGKKRIAETAIPFVLDVKYL